MSNLIHQSMRYIIFLCSLVSIGCSTAVRYEDSHQAVLVRSDPPGAAIIYKKRLVDYTPAYIRVKRKNYDKIYLKLDGEKKQRVRMRSRYRWNDSFMSNLFLLTYAPLGWTIDLISETSWRFKRLSKIKLPGATGEEVDWAIEKVAIAPPLIENAQLSTEIARKVTLELKERYPEAEIIPFRKSLDVFLEEHYSNEHKPGRKNLDSIYASLGIDHIVQTEVKDTKNKVTYVTHVNNVYSKKRVAQFDGEIEREKLKSIRDVKWIEKAGAWFTFSPNTFHVDFANASPSFKVNDVEVVGENKSSSDLLKVLGSFGVGSTERPTSYPKWRFRFQFVPSIIASVLDVEYDAVPALANKNFERWLVGGGYGPQFSWYSRWGTFNIDLIPNMVWTQITYEQNGTNREKTIDEFTGSAILEIGYSYFVTENFVLKLFARRVSEDEEIWGKVFLDATGATQNVKDVGYTYSGVSLGFYFPDNEHPMKQLYQ